MIVEHSKCIVLYVMSYNVHNVIFKIKIMSFLFPFSSSLVTMSLVDMICISSSLSSLDFAHDTHSRAILHKLLTGTDTVRERET